MDISLTRKIRLYPTAEQANQLKQVMFEYQRLCNETSQYLFNNSLFDKKGSQRKLNDALYYQFRNDSFLGAGLIQSVFKTVIARYKTVATQMKQRPFKYWDDNTKHLYKIERDLSWLQKPIQFRCPQADYVRTKNYSLANHAQQISLNGINGRLKVNYDLRNQAFLLRNDIKLGTAKLVTSGNHWFFHVSFTMSVSDFQLEDVQHVVGIDRGLRFIITVQDEHGKTGFVNGGKLKHYSQHMKYLQRQLQKKHTRSSYRRIKAIHNRENRYVTYMNHCISKALVMKYHEPTLFVLEDLTNIRPTLTKVKRQNRYNQVSWPFYQLQTMLEYKAKLNRSNVIYVDAYKTSQRCPYCGRINKNNRDHNTHRYKCDRCGYSSNDDRIGAMNILQLGTLYRSGVKKPSFRHLTKDLNNNGNKTVQIYSE